MLALLSSLAARTEQRAHPLLAERPIEKVLLVLITADRGLCGAFNANLIRAAHYYLEEHRHQEVSIIAVGRKVRDAFRKRSLNMLGSTLTCSGVSSFRTPSRLRRRSSTSTRSKRWTRLTSSITSSSPL